MDHVRRLTKKHQVTLPAVVRRALRLKPGDHIAFVVRGETATIANARMRLCQNLDAPMHAISMRDWDTPEDDEAFRSL